MSRNFSVGVSMINFHAHAFVFVGQENCEALVDTRADVLVSWNVDADSHAENFEEYIMRCVNFFELASVLNYFYDYHFRGRTHIVLGACFRTIN